MKRIAIIGAGMAGLAAAWELGLHGYKTVIYEAQPQIGGLAAGFRDEGWDWTLEKFYHHWFYSDKELWKLVDELGVRDKVLFPRPKTSFWHEGEIYQLDSPLSALRLPIISWPGKLRFGLTGLYLRMTRRWKWMEKYTADEWLRRTMGDEVYETLWRPMLIGKFGEFYNEANMAWFWARIHSRTPRLGTYEGGFQTFMEDFGAALWARGSEIKLNTPVKRIQRLPQGTIEVKTETGTDTFEAVVSTTSPQLLLKLAPQIDGDYAAQVKKLRSMGAVVVIAALDRQLMVDGTYWLNLPANSPDKTENPFPYLALVEHTNYMDKSHYNGDHLIYMGDYVPADHPYFQMSEDELADHFITSLSVVNPSFSRDWLRRQWVFRAPYAQPLPTVNHSNNIPDLKTPVSGLYWASMSQVYPWDRGTNYAIEMGRRVAKMVINDRK